MGYEVRRRRREREDERPQPATRTERGPSGPPKLLAKGAYGTAPRWSPGAYGPIFLRLNVGKFRFDFLGQIPHN